MKNKMCDVEYPIMKSRNSTMDYCGAKYLMQ